VLAAPPAFANGRFPASNQIVFSPTDPNLIVARTTYGILPSRDNGNTWQFLCEDALGLPSDAPYDPELGLTANNTLVVGLTNARRGMAPFLGLEVSSDWGCGWNCVEGSLAGQAVSDLVVRPDAPDVVLAVTSTFGLMDAQSGAYSRVFESVDDGANWGALGAALDPGVVVQTIDVARTDPERIYLSGMRAGAQETVALFVSKDKGAHWAEHTVSQFDPKNEEFLWIAGVDPTDADRVYLRSNAPINTGGKSRLYVTTDAGDTFRLALEFQVSSPMTVNYGIGELLGFALSPDGSVIYAGSKEAGLYVAARSDLVFRPVNPIGVECLATRGTELWACSEANAGFIVGVSTDGGAHFCPKMRETTSLTGPIACGSGRAATLGCGAMVSGFECKSSFDLFCQAYGGCQADARGSCDAGADAGTAAPPKSTGRGCSATGGKASGGMLAFLFGTAIAWRRRAFLGHRRRAIGCLCLHWPPQTTKSGSSARPARRCATSISGSCASRGPQRWP
jgi:hypothetical protein